MMNVFGTSSLRATLALCLAIALAGCARSAVKPPRVGLSDVRVAEATAFEQRYVFTLRLRNQQDRPLRINALGFDLEVNDQTFASGARETDLTLAPFGEQRIEIEATSTLLGLLRQLEQLGSGKELTYRMRGWLRSPDARDPIRFFESGKLPFTGRGAGRTSARFGERSMRPLPAEAFARGGKRPSLPASCARTSPRFVLCFSGAGSEKRAGQGFIEEGA